MQSNLNATEIPANKKHRYKYEIFLSSLYRTKNTKAAIINAKAYKSENEYGKYQELTFRGI